MIKMNDRNSKTKKQSGACVLPCDFHTHTGFSDDCDVPMEQMLEGAIAHGIETLAITDHMIRVIPIRNSRSSWILAGIFRHSRQYRQNTAIKSKSWPVWKSAS